MDATGVALGSGTAAAKPDQWAGGMAVVCL